MSGILARIKALFAPAPAAPPQFDADERPETAEPVTHAASPERFAPTAVLEEPGPVEAPVLVAEPAPVETPVLVTEAAPEELLAEDTDEPAPVETPPAPARSGPTLAATPASSGLVLRLESERGSPSTWEVTKAGATIGRGSESTIQLADLSVSRKHAKITYKQGAYWVSDLGSMGGTWIDGAKLAAPRRVATGQTIDIGLCRLTVVSATEERAASKGPTHAA